MSFLSLSEELTGVVPKLDINYSRTIINRAYKEIRRKNLWSFQMFDENWISPAIINAGSVTLTQGLRTIVFDVDASAVLSALGMGPFPTPLNQRQFRLGAATTIYNIWSSSLDEDTGILTCTLDRPVVDPSGTTGYMVYQCYFPAPMRDWAAWVAVRDMQNFNDLRIYTTRAQVDAWDPQRSIFYIPTDVIPYQTNSNPDYLTGYPMFELWGQPSYVLPYQLFGIRNGEDLVEDADELPAALGEDVVMAKAREYAYEWAEANKGDIARGSGSDFKFLMGKSLKEFTDLWHEYRRRDREQVDLWYSVRRITAWPGTSAGYYNAISGIANPGAAF